MEYRKQQTVKTIGQYSCLLCSSCTKGSFVRLGDQLNDCGYIVHFSTSCLSYLFHYTKKIKINWMFPTCKIQELKNLTEKEKKKGKMCFKWDVYIFNCWAIATTVCSRNHLLTVYYNWVYLNPSKTSFDSFSTRHK